MIFVTWLLVFLIAAGATELCGKDDRTKSDLQLTKAEKIALFRNLLHKALDTDGTYYRDLLITAGIIPTPPGYEILKDEGSSRTPFSQEMRDHFNTHVKDIIASLDKLEYALNRLFEEWLLLNSSVDPEDSWHQKLVKLLELEKEKAANAWSDISKDVQSEKSLDSDTEVDSALEDRSFETSQMKSLSEENLETESDTGSEFTTSSIVDEITKEYVKMFSEIPESQTFKNQNGVTLTPLDDEFIMHIMSSSTHSESSVDESTSERETEQTEFQPATEDQILPTFGRVLTFEEIQLLDQELSSKPELKYQVISTSTPDQELLSNVHFITNDETSSSKPISKKRRRVNPREISLAEPIFYQAPTPQKMILRYYRDIPDTSFTCENKTLPGFYADQETDCQVFHVCWPGRRESFLCPVGSLFNQQVLSCDNFNHTNCSLSHAYFDVNTAFQEYDDAQAHNVTPSPDPMMEPIQNSSGTTEVVAKKSDIIELFEADLHFSEMVTKVNITELWDYLPVKAKVFVYPEPTDLKKFLEEHHHHKIRKSKDVREQETNTEMEDSSADEVLDEVVESRQTIEANIVRVLKKLSRKHRD